MSDRGPVVSVVTPFYNSADCLAECIEGVLSQTFGDFEYILADNASTDGSLEIAREYARKDARVRVLHFDEFLPQIPNYNRALRAVDPASRYCKMAQADDVLLPRCLEEMVALADSDDDIAVVGAYTILQDQVFLDGLDFYESVIPGAELCRRYFEDGRYIFGSPTTHMYRTEDVRGHDPFYPEDALFADTEAVVRLVIGRKFGFVHQVLSFVRFRKDGISAGKADLDVDVLTRRVLLERYGARVLPRDRFETLRKRLFWRHHRVLGRGLLVGKRKEFWDFQWRGALREGLSISRAATAAGTVIVAVRAVGNLEAMARSFVSRAGRIWAPRRKQGES